MSNRKAMISVTRAQSIPTTTASFELQYAGPAFPYGLFPVRGVWTTDQISVIETLTDDPTPDRRRIAAFSALPALSSFAWRRT
jgi:hypothetical protein